MEIVRDDFPGFHAIKRSARFAFTMPCHAKNANALRYALRRTGNPLRRIARVRVRIAGRVGGVTPATRDALEAKRHPPGYSGPAVHASVCAKFLSGCVLE